MNQTKRSIRAFIMILSLFVLGCLINAIPVGKMFLLRGISSVYYLIIALILSQYFRYVVVEKKTRKYLVGIAGLIALWFFVRAIKYIIFKEDVNAIRYLWYLYYIPILMIPQISFTVSFYVGETEEKKPTLPVLSYIFSIALFIFVITNDLHQLVFSFNNGLENPDDYKHKVIYYIIVAWTVLIIAITLISLMHKCVILANKKLVVFPIFNCLLFSAFLILSNLNVTTVLLGINFGSLPEGVSFLMGGMWVLCIASGLVPSNKGYENLMSISSIPSQITDEDYNPIYTSKSFNEMDKEQLSAGNIKLSDGNIRAFRVKIPGGYAFWQADISELNRLNSELEDVNEALSEEGEVIRLDNELKEKQAKIDAKSKVYDDIAARVLPESLAIEKLADKVYNNPGLFEREMLQICIYGSYIKRISNLMLLESDNKYIDKTELYLSLNESARYMKKAGIPVEVSANYNNEKMLSSDAVEIFGIIKTLAEEAFSTLEGLDIIICDDEIKLNFEGVALSLPEGVKGRAEVDDDITFVRLFFRKDGESE